VASRFCSSAADATPGLLGAAGYVVGIRVFDASAHDRHACRSGRSPRPTRPRKEVRLFWNADMFRGFAWQRWRDAGVARDLCLCAVLRPRGNVQPWTIQHRLNSTLRGFVRSAIPRASASSRNLPSARAACVSCGNGLACPGRCCLITSRCCASAGLSTQRAGGDGSTTRWIRTLSVGSAN
jgi:hypothetical protein